jgi:NACalpha-BTF3-like transcription factor
LEPGVSYKLYAPDVGLVEDGALRLVKHGLVKKAAKTGPAATTAAASQAASGQKAAWKDPLARQALSWVGADPQAEQYWLQAINDPSLPPNERQDLIEDLNEEGFPDPKNLTMDDLPLILSRIEVIEEHAFDAMDEVNAAAFMEAYKDLVNMAGKLLP